MTQAFTLIKKIFIMTLFFIGLLYSQQNINTSLKSNSSVTKKEKLNLDDSRNRFPEILHEGEIQFDAAINSKISDRKIKNSKIEGSANIFVFPNLDAGNIAYKITERLAGYSAWGPLLQGLNKPIHDLSRGCNVQDIIDISVITALQKKMKADKL